MKKDILDETNLGLISKILGNQQKGSGVDNHKIESKGSLNGLSSNSVAHFADSEEMEEGISRIMKDNGLK